MLLLLMFERVANYLMSDNIHKKWRTTTNKNSVVVVET